MKRIVLIGMLGLWGIVSAQQEVLNPAPGGFFSIGASFQSWKIQDYYFPSQFSLPMKMLLPIGNRFQLMVQNTPAYSYWEEEERMLGISDTWIQGSYILWDDKLMLNLGVGIPTGKSRLDSAQYEFTRESLSQNIIQFQLPIYSQGLSGRFGFAVAYPVMERVVMGLGGQFLYRSSFHPVEYEYSYIGEQGHLVQAVWDEEFRPGHEINAHLGLDVEITEDMKIMADGIYTHYWRDYLNDVEIFGAGNKFTMHLGYFYRFSEDKYIWTHMVYRHRGKNSTMQGLSLQEEEKQTLGSQFELNVRAVTMNFTNGNIFVLGIARIYGKNEYGLGNDQAYGAGLGVSVRVAQNAVFDFNMRYLLGKYHHDERERSMEGIDTFGTLRLDF
jgi:hypothetical protein